MATRKKKKVLLEECGIMPEEKVNKMTQEDKKEQETKHSLGLFK